jgi:hypothetical protein
MRPVVLRLGSKLDLPNSSGSGRMALDRACWRARRPRLPVQRQIRG